MLKVDIDDYKVDKEKKEDKVLEEIGYTIKMEEVSPYIEINKKETDNPLCFCKMILFKNGDPDFYIKASANGEFIDPWGDGMSEGKELKYRNKRAIENQDEYVAVPDDVFHSYLLFLKTRNQLHYRRAEKRNAEQNEY